MKQHLANLRQQHRELDKQISGATYISPQLRQLKTLRLRLKDKILTIQRGTISATA